MTIQAVVMVSLVIAFVVLGIMALVEKLIVARKARLPRKPRLPIGELPLSEEETEAPDTTIRNAEMERLPVYWFENRMDRKHPSFGFLERIRGKRAIIRLASGKRVRRKAYLVCLMDGQRLGIPPTREPKRLPSVMEVTSEDPAVVSMLEIERCHGAVPTSA